MNFLPSFGIVPQQLAIIIPVAVGFTATIVVDVPVAKVFETVLLYNWTGNKL